MLTKRSGKLASGKKLFIIPLVLTATICFTQLNTVFGQRVVDGNIITYNGNKFEKLMGETDTVYVQDPVTGEIQVVLTTKEGPIIKVNNEETLHQYYAIDSPPIEIASVINKLKAEISSKITNEIEQLKKVKQLQLSVYSYAVDHIVIDKNGRVIYYEMGKNKTVHSGDGNWYEIPKDINDKINNKIVNTLQDIVGNKMYKDGKQVSYVLRIRDEFIIK